MWDAINFIEHLTCFADCGMNDKFGYLYYGKCIKVCIKVGEWN